MESFDVIIVGAGPAGLKCAETLGNSKYKVLLLEKNSEIGPKICAGGLTGKDIEYLNLPQHLIDFHYDEIKFHINNSKFYLKNKNNFAFTIDRKNLGQWQLKNLKKLKNLFQFKIILCMVCLDISSQRLCFYRLWLQS
jgi:geranylgeranyl reductase